MGADSFLCLIPIEGRAMSIAIEQTYELNAAPADVFEALTEPDKLVRWWATEATSDPVPGGAYEFIMKFENSTGHAHKGHYIEVDPNQRVVYSWEWGGFPTQVEFTLEGSGDKTTLRLNHTGFEHRDDLFEGTSKGWASALGNLEAWINAGEDNRRANHGQIVPA